MALQPRLTSAISLFCQPKQHSNFMLIKAEDNRAYLALIAEYAQQQLLPFRAVHGGYYQFDNQQINWSTADATDDQFAVNGDCLYEEWYEHEQLFGCIRCRGEHYSLQPGLVHRANGGVLVLSIRTLLTQPLLWFRLKQIIASQHFHWLSPDENKPLPLTIPSIPLSLRVILVGDRFGLSDLQEFEPELITEALYAEFEAELKLNDQQDMQRWCAYVNSITDDNQLPRLATETYPLLVNAAVRESGDQLSLPLSPVWLNRQTLEASRYLQSSDNLITAKAFTTAQHQKLWRESYLLERAQDEIDQGQLHIETEGFVIGQINALSILEYPGHPRPFGEPSRISCVVHFGDGEVTDVERKAELGGNLHAKGMMIMQAFITAELSIDQQLPFSASIVFEQSYGEVDGDSASLAELCALISALSAQPINQQIAVTGSVDQFGNIQPIGGINEKIEAFFNVCQQRGLTGSQGVIIPVNNIRHLCLNDAVVEAVKEGYFHLWYAVHVADALPLLMELPYQDETKANLLQMIQDRIEQINIGHRHRSPWFLRWLG